MEDLKRAYYSVAESLTPVLKNSRFRETGVLTPEEFVAAGDHMVHHCPTWQWGTPHPTKIKDYLPKEKQFLITKNVPCFRRCKDMEYDPGQEKVLGGGEGEGMDEDAGWVDTHHYAKEGDSSTTMGDKAKDMGGSSSTPGAGGNGTGRAAASGDSDEDEEDGEAADMDAMMEQLDDLDVEDEDPNVASKSTASGGKQEDKKGGDEDEKNILETRSYDLNITYDKYYQVPRMWLTGYDEKRNPLSIDGMYEDFSEDHAKKTITMEAHPHLPGGPMASIHPCRHAEVMKRLMEQLAESGGELEVEQYLLIFLKFVQAVIPTIEYDYTQNVKIGV